jgi:putative thioredoxin
MAGGSEHDLLVGIVRVGGEVVVGAEDSLDIDQVFGEGDSASTLVSHVGMLFPQVGHVAGTCKNGAMTSASFSRHGAVDLSAIAQQTQASGAPAGPGGSSYATEITSLPDFEALVRQSMQYPVVILFNSARAQGGQAMSNDLGEVIDGQQGRLLLARVDVDAHPDVAQALSIQAVPTVIALLGGQAAPLFQGVQPKSALTQVMEQVLQAAVANGIVGTAEPQAGGGQQPDAGSAQQPPPVDPRFEAAYAAMETGNFEAAREEFEKLLKETPNNAEAQVGRAQAGLLARSSQLDGSEAVRAAAEPGNIEAQLAAADAEVIGGNAEAAFARLVELVRGTRDDEREQVRRRLLELFETLGGTDPAVLKYRRKLASALF